jgi:hypothetical protein
MKNSGAGVMANEKDGSKTRSGASRPTPTIDLTATEVGTETATDETPPASAPDAAGAKAAPSGGAEATQTGVPPPREPHSRNTSFGWLPAARFWSLIGAAVLGAGGAVLIMLAFGTGGDFSSRDSGSDVVAARLNRIETRLQEISTRPASAAIDAKFLDDIAARLAKIEAALSSPRAPDPVVASGVTAVENQEKSASEELASLKGRVDEIASLARAAQNRADAAVSGAERDGVANRIATLEQTVKANEAELIKRRLDAADDRVSRLAVAASALREAVERGDPFITELAAAKSLAPDRPELTLLEPFASGGIPPAHTLARELSSLVPVLFKNAGDFPRDGGFLEKLQANAARLVRVRPVGDAPGNDPATVIARIESKAARSDVDGALEELGKLPPAIRAPAETWIKKAQARAAAIAASRQFARDALAPLGRSG